MKWGSFLFDRGKNMATSTAEVAKEAASASYPHITKRQEGRSEPERQRGTPPRLPSLALGLGYRRTPFSVAPRIVAALPPIGVLFPRRARLVFLLIPVRTGTLEELQELPTLQRENAKEQKRK